MTIFSKGGYSMEELLETLYPIGSIYISSIDTGNVCPLAKLGGTWAKVSTGRVLQGADNTHSAGSNIEAGLPNITGNAGNAEDVTGGTFNGAFQRASSNAGSQTWGGGISEGTKAVSFDASRCNKIYGSSTTVQPPAYCVVIWRRVA